MSLLSLPTELLCNILRQLLRSGCSSYQSALNLMCTCRYIHSLFVGDRAVNALWKRGRLLGGFHRLQTLQKAHFISTSSYGWRHVPFLAAPFDVVEVERFEKESGTKLPTDFRDYITQFTKELLISSYPTVVELPNTGTWVGCRLPEDVCYVDPMTPSKEQYRSFEQSLLEIGNGGCAFYDAMVIKGERLGSIWEHCDPEHYLSAKSFSDLVEHILRTFADRPSAFGTSEWSAKRSPLLDDSFKRSQDFTQ